MHANHANSYVGVMDITYHWLLKSQLIICAESNQFFFFCWFKMFELKKWDLVPDATHVELDPSVEDPEQGLHHDQQ